MTLTLKDYRVDAAGFHLHFVPTDPVQQQDAPSDYFALITVAELTPLPTRPPINLAQILAQKAANAVVTQGQAPKLDTFVGQSFPV